MKPWTKKSFSNTFGWLYWMELVLSSGLFGILYYVAVPAVDDLWFSMPVDVQDTVGRRFIDAITLTSDRWQTDMLRLPNQMVAVLLMICPRWSVGLLVSLLCIGAIEGGRRIIGSDVADCTTYAWIFCFWICLPWYDYMLSLSYILNYVLPSALALWTLYLFQNIDKNNIVGGKLLYAIVLAFLAGWAHECFAVPLAAGMGTYILSCLCCRQNISKKQFGMFVSLCIGIFVILCSPILATRASEGGSKVSGMPLWEMLIQLGPSVLAVSVVLIVCLTVWFRHKKLPLVLTEFISICLVAELIAFVFYNGPRTTWAAVLYSMVAVFVGLRTVRLRKWMTVGIAVLSITGVTFNLGASIEAQTGLSMEIKEITEKYHASSNGEVYYDVTRPKVDATLFKTTVRILNERIPLRFIENFHDAYIEHGKAKKINILPTKLMDFPGLKFDPRFEGQRIRVYRNIVVADTIYENALEKRIPLILVDKKGNEIESRYRTSSFHAGDGKRYIVIFPHAQILDATLEIKASRLLL